ncbi:hypothetical protein WK55_00205 [Burkholderia ubonensis]|nr:hypothetical protein WK55_00205 [Burkholderia ubonensis]
MGRIMVIRQALEVDPLLREFSRHPPPSEVEIAHPAVDRLTLCIHAVDVPPVHRATRIWIRMRLGNPPIRVTRQFGERIHLNGVRLSRQWVSARNELIILGALIQHRARRDPQHRRLGWQAQCRPVLLVRTVLTDPFAPLLDKRLDAVVAKHLDVRHPGSGRALVQRVVAAEVADQVAGPDRDTASISLRVARGERLVRRYDYPVEHRVREDFLDHRPTVFLPQINPAADVRGWIYVSAGYRRVHRSAEQVRNLAPFPSAYFFPLADSDARALRQDADGRTIGSLTDPQPLLRRIGDLPVATR